MLPSYACTHRPFITVPCIEKSQVFRIEERFLSPANSPAKTAVAAPQHTPQAAHTTASHKDAVAANTNINSSSTPPLPMTVASPNSQHQFIGHAEQPQAVVVHNVPTYVQQQSPIPFVMPQVSLENVDF